MKIGAIIWSLWISCLLCILGWIYWHRSCAVPRKISALWLSYQTNDGSVQRGNPVMTVIRNDQQIGFTLVFEDAYGNAVSELGSQPEWQINDDSLATLQVSEDAMSVILVPKGPKGSVLLTVKVDTDPDEDVEELIGQAEITILSGKAKVVRLAGVISDRGEEVIPTDDAPEHDVVVDEQ